VERENVTEALSQEALTPSSTVFMLDKSRSMFLNSCFPAAKEAALALDALIRSRFPRGRRKNIVIYGSASVVQALMDLGLIDEYQLLVHPIVLGSGKRLFRDGSNTTALRLVEAKPFSSGVVLLSYRPAEQERDA
jgi:dihydrofolate reductase